MLPARPGPLSLLTALLTTLALLAFAPAAALGFNFGKPAFCEPREPVADFGFSELLPIAEIPTDGKLPFAPPGVEIFGDWSGRVLNEPGSVGYGFVDEEFLDGPVRLDWTVTAQMWLLGGDGNALREVDSDRLVIGRLDGVKQPHINVETARRRGFYRLDIQFADRTGAQLGAYSAYVKLTRSFWKANLSLDRRAYRPGQRVIHRLEILGTEWASYGEEFSVQRLRRGTWTPLPRLTPGPWASVLYYGGPGALHCGALHLPPGTAPGHYRIVKRVVETISARRYRSRWLTAPFTVR